MDRGCALKVLYTTQSIDRSEAALLGGLSRMGHDVVMACFPETARQEELTEEGVRVEFVPVKHRMDIAARGPLRRVISQLGPDIIYAPSNVTLANALRATSGRFKGMGKIPVIGYRGTIGHISRLDPAAWMTYLNGRLACIVCVSEAVRRYLKSAGVPSAKLATIPKGHDADWYGRKSADARSGEGIPRDAFVVGFTGNMRPVKGVIYLIEAMRHLPDSLNIHLLLVGEVRDRQVTSHLESSPARKRIHATGYRKDAASLAGASDVFVMPSVDREGLPRSVIEAMSCGVPPIVTRVGGMTELVINGENGIVVEPRDSRALARAILELAQDRDRRVRLGQRARARIVEHFNIESMISSTAELFERTILNV